MPCPHYILSYSAMWHQECLRESGRGRIELSYSVLLYAGGDHLFGGRTYEV
jgi:hypothetical protein